MIRRRPGVNIVSAPEADSIFKLKYAFQRSENLKLWLILNCLLCMVIYLDICNGYRMSKFLFDTWLPYSVLTEKITFGLMCFNAGYIAIVIIKPYLTTSWIFLTQYQRQLLGASTPGIKIKSTATNSSSITVTPSIARQISSLWWLPSSWSNLDWLYRIRAPAGRCSYYTAQYIGKPDQAELSSNSREISISSSPQLLLNNSSGNREFYPSPTSSWSPQFSNSVGRYISSYSSSLSTPYSPNQFSISAYSPGTSVDNLFSPGAISSQYGDHISYATPSSSNISSDLSNLLKSPQRFERLYSETPSQAPGSNSTSSYLLRQNFYQNPEAQFQSAANWTNFRRARSESPFVSRNDISFVNSRTKVADYSKAGQRIYNESIGDYISQPNESTFGLKDANLSNSNLRFINFSPIKASKYQISTISPSERVSTPDFFAGNRSLSGSEALHRSNSVVMHAGISSNALASTWARYDIALDYLDSYTLNLRLWISKTILKPIADEIQKINDNLKSISRPDLFIGDASVSSLQNLVVTSKTDQLQFLSVLIPYLELTSNQSYLVQRLRELAMDSFIGEYQWNQGGRFKGKKWDDTLPTDAAIVLHCFCTYMDAKLPPNPLFPDGRTFANQFISQAPNKPKRNSNNAIFIFQTTLNPPHCQIIINEETVDVGKAADILDSFT